MSVADVERYAYNVSNSYLSREVITFDGKSRINNEVIARRRFAPQRTPAEKVQKRNGL
ncbi:MAG: hypothetical protein NC548_45520 [Lachnospiraceae bacterium]|nr:hypothetical protein [Lachnospiraceae bacterium]